RPMPGRVVVRSGPRLMAISGGSLLLPSGLLAAFAPADSLVALVLALILLGIGWNIGLVSGSTLVVQGTQPDTRAATQGSIDVWYQIFGAGAGVVSGILMSAAGFGVLAVVGGILAVIILPTVFLTRKVNTDTAAQQS